MSSWYSTGYDGMKTEEDRLAALSGPSRLWMPADSSRNLIFLDDEPFTIYEHNPKIDGDWRNWITCLQGVSDEVPCCEKMGPNSRYYIGYYTVIDASEYTDKKGNKHAFELKLLGAKMKTMKKFRRKKEERGSLIGCMYKATREDNKSPSVGDEFEFVREVDLVKAFDATMYRGKKLSEFYSKTLEGPDGLEKLKKVFQVQVEDGKPTKRVVPFNYMEVLKPRASKDLKLFLASAKIETKDSDSGDSNSSGSSSEDVPF